MKVRLAKRPTVAVIELEPGQAFIHQGTVYLASAPGSLESGKRFNAVSLNGGTLYHFPGELEVEVLNATLVEDDIVNAEVEL